MLSHTFFTLRNRNYRLFFLGQAFSFTGNQMQIIAESWLVYRLTGSPLALGAVGFVALIPVVPISLFGAAIIDRARKRNLLVVTQSALMATYLVLAVLTWSGQVQIWHIILVQFVAGALGSIDLPARQAFLAEIVQKDDLPNSIALNTFLFNLGRVIGPAAAGLIIVGAGEAGCFALNSLSFLPFLSGLLLMRDLRQVKLKERRTLAGTVVQGLDYVRRNSVLVWLLTLLAVSSMLLLSYITMMPVLAKDILQAGPQGLGMLMTSVGIGAMIGSLWLAKFKASDQQRWLIIALYALAISIIALTSMRDLTIAIAIALTVGVATAWMQTIFNTLVQIYVRDDMRGRTMSMHFSLFVGMQQVGGLQAGVLAEWRGIAFALATGAVASMICTTVALWRRPLDLLSRSSSDIKGDTAAVTDKPL